MKRPNIVLITWHDLGDWLGSYGHEDVSSPCLDRLAGEGVLFENHFCTAPQCSPSRASIVTGLMPHSTGVMGLTHRGFDMDRGQTTLPQVFRGHGYTTHLIGLQHECRDPRWEGYDEVASKQKTAEYVATEAEAFFTSRRGRSDKPFFLALGTSDIHRPHGEAYDPEVARRLKLPPYLPDCEAARRDMAVFYHRIKEADRQMGRVFDALDCSGLGEETIVIFTTDHGAAIPRAKTTMYDAGLKTALIMRWPGRIKAGMRSDALLSNLDLFPTLLELAGIEIPKAIHGRSFGGLLLGRPYEPREEVFAEMTWHTQYRPMRAIRTSDHKYIINFCAGIPMIVEAGAMTRYGADTTEKYYSSPLPAEELYDLRRDPLETHNLADDRRHNSIKDDLRDRLVGWLRQTDDPILKGPVPNPDPQSAEPEVWVERDGRFRLRRDVAWPWQKCKP